MFSNISYVHRNVCLNNSKFVEMEAYAIEENNFRDGRFIRHDANSIVKKHVKEVYLTWPYAH
jgi:hypothetical protein